MRDDNMRELLRRLADDLPEKSPVPANLVGRTRRRATGRVLGAGTALAAVVAAGVLVAGSFDESGRERRVPPAATPEDQGSPAPLPGGRILMVGFDGRDSDLFVLDVASRQIEQLTSNEVLETSPSWAPDGRSFVYEAYKGVHASSGDAIFVGDGDRSSELVDVGTSDAHPDWAPDGSRIAFDSTDGGIYVVRRDGSGLDRVVEGGEFPAWAPDGTRLAYVRSDAVFTVDLAGGEPVKVEGTEGAADVDWSPDGAWLTFSTYDGSSGDVYVVSATGGTPRQVTFTDAPERNPSWSPDGSWIAAVRVVDARARIVAVPGRGEGSEVVLTPERVDFVEPDWGPPAR